MKSFDSLTSRPVTKKDNESIYYGNDPQNRPLEVLVFEQKKTYFTNPTKKMER